MMVSYASVHPYPAWIVVDRYVTGDSVDSFSVCVEEFSQAVDVTNFVLY